MRTNSFNSFVRELYQSKDGIIPLHEPNFNGNEKEYLLDTVESTFVSSVGKYVDEVENFCSNYTGIKKTVAVVNGTAAIQIALKLVGVIAIIDSLIFKIPELYKLFNISSTSSLRESPF